MHIPSNLQHTTSSTRIQQECSITTRGFILSPPQSAESHHARSIFRDSLEPPEYNLATGVFRSTRPYDMH